MLSSPDDRSVAAVLPLEGSGAALEFLDLFEEVLREGARLRLRVGGRSMASAVLPGDVVEIEKAGPWEIRKGDIILFRRRPEGVPILHRVISKKPAGRGAAFQTRGDAVTGSEGPVFPADILGKLVSGERKGLRNAAPVRAARRIFLLVRSQARRVAKRLLGKPRRSI